MAMLSSRHAFWMTALLMLVMPGFPLRAADRQEQARPEWKVGTPIVAYWAGPALTDRVARQMAEGGWNLAWCTEKELDVAQRHGLRAQLQDGLLSPASLDDPAKRQKLDALVARVRMHPAVYSYFITDEPAAAHFPALGRLVAYLRQRDPAHLAYINLFPTYANNQQLGTQGDTVSAYREHLRQYLNIVKPSLVSYDHYQFSKAGDNEQYFLNLALVRQALQQAGVPFLHIVQACTWTPSMRVPTGDEMRYLVYTTLAYGAQGISYYVYCCPGHTGGIALADGTPTPIYHALKPLNREFVAIASELQPLRSLGVYHAGMKPPGAEPLSKDAPFRLDPPVASAAYRRLQPVKGILMGFFGPAGKGQEPGKPTHVLVVNLDYQARAATTIVGPEKMEVLDAALRTWSSAAGNRAPVELPPGGGRLLRLQGAKGARAQWDGGEPTQNGKNQTASSGASPDSATRPSTSPLSIDADFPSGNIIVDRVDGDDVFLRQDLRDTSGWWFYWSFRVSQAAGRTLRFHFTNKNVLGPQGPAYSLDRGAAWSWLGSKRSNTEQTPPKDGFLFRFPTDAAEVRFCFAVPYVESDLRQFLDRRQQSSALKTGILCRTAKGRPAEVLYLGRLDGQGQYHLAFTCRHHACESVASYVLEGLMDSVLGEDATGRWFREHAASAVIPFVDKDGVEGGDQGKNRKPHDHNRDYAGGSIYPTVAAIKRLLPEWSNGRLDMAIDLHCPSINDSEVQFIGGPDQNIWRRTLKLSRYLESCQGGPLRHDASRNMPFGTGWNTGSGLKSASFAGWASQLPNIRIATSIEMPYSQVGRTPVSCDAARTLGRDLARAIKAYLEKER